MKIGVVGAEASRWTIEGEDEARDLIRVILSAPLVTEVVSGGCHRGGVDKWAAEIGRELRLTVTEFLPANHSWETGYRPRNVLIAEASDFVHCLTVDHAPEGLADRVDDTCFHCGVRDHKRSGGCWTAKRAQILGKPTQVHVIRQKDVVAVRAREEAALMVETGAGTWAPYLHGCFNRLFKYSSMSASFSNPLNRERFIRIGVAEATRIIESANTKEEEKG